jgi:hypothetical protein
MTTKCEYTKVLVSVTCCVIYTNLDEMAVKMKNSIKTQTGRPNQMNDVLRIYNLN